MRLTFWSRVAIVASVIWFGLMLMAANIWTDFHFFAVRGSHLPDRAFNVTAIGLAIIWVARMDFAGEIAGPRHNGLGSEIASALD